MPMLSKPSPAARLSVMYITIGALIDVWSGIWFWYMSNHPPENEAMHYWCWGFLFTGATLLAIGLALGKIGRAAQHAELPPEALPSAALPTALAAAPTAVLVPSNGPVSAVPAAGMSRAKV
jgi:RsiW-degrading membrane proteinase PrsW (M82 family)